MISGDHFSHFNPFILFDHLTVFLIQPLLHKQCTEYIKSFTEGFIHNFLREMSFLENPYCQIY